MKNEWKLRVVIGIICMIGSVLVNQLWLFLMGVVWMYTGVKLLKKDKNRGDNIEESRKQTKVGALNQTIEK